MSYFGEAQAGVVDANNSTSVALDSNETFTGTWTNVLNYSTISIMGSTDQNTELIADFSHNGSNIVKSIVLSPAETSNLGPHLLAVFGKFFRVRILNQSNAQESLVLQTILNTSSKTGLPTTRLQEEINSYSDVLNTRTVLFGINPAGGYENVPINEGRGLATSMTNSIAAYGEISTTNFIPLVQVSATYGILDNIETFIDTSPGTGTATTSNGNFLCKTGTGVGGYSVIRSRRAVKYRPGQGLLFRWSAGYDTPTALSLQASGPFNSTNGYLVGFNGNSSFGIMHRYGGRHEIRTLTLSANATGSETVSLTLNGVLYSIPVTSGSAAHNTYEVATWLNANQVIWEAYQNTNKITLFAKNQGSLSSTYSVSSTGTFAGSIVQGGAGAANTETWVYQGAFSDDQLDGTGSSGMIIDTTKCNLFECSMQHLGYGEVKFKIQNPATGRFFTFHRLKFANETTSPSLYNPSMKVGWVSTSLGSTTDLTVYGSSAIGAIEGAVRSSRRPRSFSNQRASVGATITSIFAIRIRSAFRNVVQLSEVLPKAAYVSVEGTKACQVSFLLNPVFAGEPNWNFVDETDSIVQYDITGTTFASQGTSLASFVVGGATTERLDFSVLSSDGTDSVYLERGDVLCIAAKIVGGSGSPVTASLTWLEET